LRDFVQMMEFLDPKQYKLQNYYDSPDFNMVGKLGQDFLRFDQFISSRLPLEDAKLHPDGPWWWPLNSHKYSYPDGRLLKLKSTRETWDGKLLLHKDGNAFFGITRAHAVIDRFLKTEEADTTDQNRFNWGPMPTPNSVRHATQDSKFLWEHSWCPWGWGNQISKKVTNEEELLEFEKLAIESYMTGESSRCENYRVDKEYAEMNPGVYVGFYHFEKGACQTGGLLGASAPYQMDLLREHFPYNDECYRRQNYFGLTHLQGMAITQGYAYHLRWNWFDASKQGFVEFWLGFVLLPALFCGNHRGKVEHKLNKIHD